MGGVVSSPYPLTKHALLGRLNRPIGPWYWAQPMTDSHFYFLRALRYWDQLPSLIQPFVFFLIVGPFISLPFLVYGMAVKKRRPEILKKNLQLLGQLWMGVFFGFLFLFVVVPVCLLLIIAAAGVLLVVGVPFLIIKGIKFIWHF